MTAETKSAEKRIQLLLSEIHLLGRSQLELYKQKTNRSLFSCTFLGHDYLCVNDIFMPTPKAQAKLISDPMNFLVLLIEKFWNLFGEIVNSMHLPIVQFALRTQLELTEKIIYYISRNRIEQKDIAIQYWLLNIGMFHYKYRQKWLKIYNELIKELSDNQIRVIYTKLKEENFPVSKISKELLAKLFVSPRAEKIFEEVKDFLGKDTSRETLQYLYSFLSNLIHGNLFLLESITKGRDYEHLFRCGAILSWASKKTIELLQKHVNMKVDMVEKEKLYKQVLNLLFQLHHLK